MSSSMTLPVLALVLVLLPMISMGDHNGDHNGTVCDDVDCGKGTCVPEGNSFWGYSCQCETGWKRTQPGDDDHRFLPCVIPNCTLDYSCQAAPPPVPSKEIPHNRSFFDPCYWIYCGSGTCTKNGSYEYRHTCTCNPGYFNLLNVSYYPCYSDCTIGNDCAKLGIKVSNSTSSGSSPSSGNGSNYAGSILPGKLQWMVILLVSMGMAQWK